MDQCHGLTLKNDRCRRRVRTTKDNQVDGKVYCTVHLGNIKVRPIVPLAPVIIPKIPIVPYKQPNQYENNRIRRNNRDAVRKELKDKELLLKNIPVELYDDVKDLPLADLKIMFPDALIEIPEEIMAIPKQIKQNNDIDDYDEDNIFADIIAGVTNSEMSADVMNELIPKEILEQYKSMYNIYNMNPDQINPKPNQQESEPIPLIDPEALFECQCCYCENFMKDQIKCSEGHEFCQDCLTQYVTDRVTGGDYKLKCMANTTCTGIFSHIVLKKILDPKLYKTYADKEIQEVITSAELGDIHTCPKCLVYFAILDEVYKSMQKEPKFECLNPDCKYVMCYKCKNDFHGNMDCNYIKRDKDVRKTIEEILTKHRTRACPKCSKHFLRTDGCNKMTCSCHTKSCYVCRIKINDYEHFHNTGTNNTKKINGKCPLYTNESEIVKMSFTSALDEIYETYKHDNDKLLNEVYPILGKLEKEHIAEIDKKFQNNKLKIIPNQHIQPNNTGQNVQNGHGQTVQAVEVKNWYQKLMVLFN